jgi:SAM-dependent methyltransferase
VIKENVYGHAKRLRWIESHTREQDSVLELGCGTGYMITLPMAKCGYSIKGFDLDVPSIEYGKNLCREEGLDVSCLSSSDITSMDTHGDVIIISEVLEHLKDEEIEQVLDQIRGKLTDGGRLLVTVPNGFGWFEMESFLWNKLRLGTLIEWIGMVEIIYQVKKLFWGEKIKQPPHPSTLSESPHIQRFTLSSIQKKITHSGFEVIETTGSVLFAGPISNLLFHGVNSFLKFNCSLGGLRPSLASGFFIACRLPKTPS